jgi:hypothetical protein
MWLQFNIFNDLRTSGTYVSDIKGKTGVPLLIILIVIIVIIGYN